MTVPPSADQTRGDVPLPLVPPLRRPCWELARLAGDSSAATADFLFFLEPM